MTRAEQIQEAFQKFLLANPSVWTLFQRFALELIAAGHAHYSADAICHRIRWHYATEQKDAEVKLNNNFSCYLARLFHKTHPVHAGFFRNRERISESQPARHPDKQFFPGTPDV